MKKEYKNISILFSDAPMDKICTYVDGNTSIWNDKVLGDEEDL